MIGSKFISEFSADPLFVFFSVVGLSARYALCYGIQLSPGASMSGMVFLLSLLGVDVGSGVGVDVGSGVGVDVGSGVGVDVDIGVGSSVKSRSGVNDSSSPL